jgi:hypothetical protein
MPGQPRRWLKCGLIFNVDGRQPWMRSHAQLPTPSVRDEVVRIFFASRDCDGRSRIGFLDADADDPSRIRSVHPNPVLELGEAGRFDDCGVMPSCVVEERATLFLYYVGWTTSVPARHRTAIGLAISDDGGLTFVRASADPLAKLTPEDSPGTSTCFVLRDGGSWRMWYTSTLGWVDVGGRPEERYVIKHASSHDGTAWSRGDHTCIAPLRPTEASGRPWVVRERDCYRMWFSYRDVEGFRDDPVRSYRIGYAESHDGLAWRRADADAGIDRSDEGWDSAMVAYPSVYSRHETSHLLYNGNGFGASGIGHAVTGG